MDIDIKAIAGDTGVLTIMLQGNLSIRNSTTIKDSLLEHLAATKSIQIELAEVTSLDLAILQLLYALKQDSTKSIPIKAKLPVDILELIKRAGLESIFE